jgi:hypothetical protein
MSVLTIAVAFSAEFAEKIAFEGEADDLFPFVALREASTRLCSRVRNPLFFRLKASSSQPLRAKRWQTALALWLAVVRIVGWHPER